MDLKALYKISYGLYVLGSRLDGKNAGCVCDAFIQSTSSPSPTAILCSIQTNQTNAAIKQTGEFTVSVLGADVDPFLIGNMGFQSGRDADKWADVAHEIENGLPALSKSAAYFRCRVTDLKELSTHTAFFCDIVDARQGEGEPLTYGEYQKNLKGRANEAFSAFKAGTAAPQSEKKWTCTICGYVYNGEVPFEQLPEDWKCPVCGHPKSDFVKK